MVFKVNYGPVLFINVASTGQPMRCGKAYAIFKMKCH